MQHTKFLKIFNILRKIQSKQPNGNAEWQLSPNHLCRGLDWFSDYISKHARVAPDGSIHLVGRLGVLKMAFLPCRWKHTLPLPFPAPKLLWNSGHSSSFSAEFSSCRSASRRSRYLCHAFKPFQKIFFRTRTTERPP